MPKSESLNNTNASAEAKPGYINDWVSSFYELNVMILKIRN